MVCVQKLRRVRSLRDSGMFDHNSEVLRPSRLERIILDELQVTEFQSGSDMSTPSAESSS